MTRQDRADHGRSERGLVTLELEADGGPRLASERHDEQPRRSLEPFPRPLSSNGLRAPDGPLVARHHLPPVRVSVPKPQGGRVARFVASYGWRALVIPVLAVATFVTMLDVASTETTPASSVVEPTASPPATTAAETTPDAVEATPTAEGEAAPATPPPVVAPVPFVEQGTGELSAVPGSSPVYGTGPLRRFIVEVEDGINVDGAGFAAAVEGTLADPRSWGAGGEMSFQRVDGGDYDFRVSLVSPLNVESFCPGVGTGGYTSCRYGERAVINLARWETAVPDYEGDVETYRRYVVNHEVGHALGNGHEPCPGSGELAPVMQQQTLGLDGCVKNPWPFPNG